MWEFVSENTTQNVWIAFQFGSTTESKIADLRDTIATVLPSAFDPELSPHLSVIPGAVIPAGTDDQLVETVERSAQGEYQIPVTGVSLYPYYDPYVVRLDVSIRLREMRSTLIDEIYELGGSLLYPPVTPHITLFKGGNEKESTTQLQYTAYRDLHQSVAVLNEDETNTEWLIKDCSLELMEF